MKSNHVNIKDVFDSQKETDVNELYERVITVPIEARTALKNELIAVIGQDRTKGVFTRYGWHCGVSDAEKVMSMQWEDKLEIIRAGPKFHMLHGYLDRVEILKIDFDEQQNLDIMEALWINTFEAE